MVTCPSCGRENADNFNFCLDCGTELSAAPAPAPAKPAPAPAKPAPAAAAAPAKAVTASRTAPLPPQPVTDPDLMPPAMTPPMQAATPAKPAAPAAAPAPAPAAAPAPARAPTAAPAPIAMPAGRTGNLPPLQAAPQPIAPARSGTAPIASVAPPAATAAAPAPVAAPVAAAAAGAACPKCGTVNPTNMKFCGNCGQKLDPSAAAPAVGGAGKTMFMHAADMSALTQPKARLITIDQTGKEGMTFSLNARETVCGRTTGTILFFDDPFVSPQHCTFVFENGRLAVRDHDSLNGIYIRLRPDTLMDNGDLLRLGRQLYKLEIGPGTRLEVNGPRPGDDARLWGSPDPRAWGKLLQILDDGTAGEVHLLNGEECRIGREVGDILLTNDGFISANHCALAFADGKVLLRDLGSSNGTYVRLRGERELRDDDFVLIGNQMLRVELR